jgi:hypothetical protein
MGLLFQIQGKWVSTSRWSRLCATATDFVSAFKEPGFKWQFVCSFFGSVGGTFSGFFNYYWLEDCFPAGYWFFGFEIATNVQSAVAINAMLGTIIGSCTHWSGPWWRDRFGGRQMLICA